MLCKVSFNIINMLFLNAQMLIQIGHNVEQMFKCTLRYVKL